MYGLIGEKLGHSYSVLIHQLLTNHAYQYELIELSQDSLGSFLERKSFEGLNVTIPYKKTVIPFLKGISPEAEKIGSVNTILSKPEGLFGYNTDYAGFLYMAKRAGVHFSGKKVLIMGTGGTSAAVCAAVKDHGARDIIVVSRSGQVNYQNLDVHRDSQIIINTTPVGMYPNNGETLIDLEDFPDCEGVLDVIYNPLYTNLVLQAQERKLAFGCGLVMLTAQAKYASDLFLNRKADDSIIDVTVEQMIHRIQNIVFIGMPGCGKSTIGKAIAELTGRIFIDTDIEIVHRAGKEISKIFSDDGESVFRRFERDVIQEKGKENSLVISTGGGAVLDKKNRMALRQNGKVFFLERNVDALSMEGRPLSINQAGLSQMYQNRLPFYEDCCDERVINDHLIDITIQEIMQKLEKK